MNMGSVGPMLAGSFTWWTPRRVQHDRLYSALAPIGIGDWCPPPIARSVALKTALRQYAKLRRKEWVKGVVRVTPDGVKVRWDVDVQRHSSADQFGFEVVLIERTSDKGKNHYHHMFSAMVVSDKDASGTIVGERVEVTSGLSNADEYVIDRSYQHHRTLVSGSNIGRFLVKAVKAFNGATLVEMGGVYYIPGDMSIKWEKLCSAMESCNAAEITRQVVEEISPSTARALLVAINKEIAKMVEKVTHEIAQKDMSATALRNRIRSAEYMMAKAAQYADITDDTVSEMKTLRDMIRELQERADQAADAAYGQQAAENEFADLMNV